MSIKVRFDYYELPAIFCLGVMVNFTKVAIWAENSISKEDKSEPFFATMGIASLVMPGIIGIIADKWFNAERLYGLCHIVGAACLFYASTATGYDQMYWAMLLNLLVYMPTLSLANTVSYNALEQYKCDLIKDFPLSAYGERSVLSVPCGR